VTNLAPALAAALVGVGLVERVDGSILGEVLLEELETNLACELGGHGGGEGIGREQVVRVKGKERFGAMRSPPATLARAPDRESRTMTSLREPVA
jgi:hypothetical protein